MTLYVEPRMSPSSGGENYAGAKLYFYLTGTTTPAPIYTDAARTTQHANPVIADSGGVFAPIWLDSTLTYRRLLKTSAGAALSDVDPYPGTVTGAAELSDLPGGGNTPDGDALVPSHNGGGIDVGIHSTGSTNYPDAYEFGVFLQVDRADNATTVGSSDGSFRIYSKATNDNILYFAKWNYGTQVWDYKRFLSEDDAITNTSGTWTPTATAVDNISSGITMSCVGYIRVGNFVHFAGAFNCSCTAASAASIRVSLPVASNFTTIRQACGVGGFEGTPTLTNAITIQSIVATDDLLISWYAADTSAHVGNFTGMYKIL